MLQSTVLETSSRHAAPFTEILRCPITHHNLRELSSDEVHDINQHIRDGAARHYAGNAVKREIEAGFQTVGARFIYPVQDGIVVLLPSLAIIAGDGALADRPSALRQEKQAVLDFYNEVGWTKCASGDFVDAEKWEDLRPVSRDYRHQCHLRAKRYLKPHGRYLLDVASGPVQYDEYLSYSADYRARICVDISFAALQAARAKLGDHGIYILGDITNLPLRDNVVDGAVSLHTIYHVPADEQATAFREIYRVLQRDCTAVVVYSWRSWAVRLVQLPAGIVRGPFKLLRKLLSRGGSTKSSADRATTAERPTTTGPVLYYHAHSYAWLARLAREFPCEILVWRSASIKILQAYFHTWLLGRAGLALLFRLEELLPHFFGRYGMYPLIVLRKKDE